MTCNCDRGFPTLAQVLKEKMDVLRLTFYTAPVSVGILVPFFLLTEFRKLITYG